MGDRASIIGWAMILAYVLVQASTLMAQGAVRDDYPGVVPGAPVDAAHAPPALDKQLKQARGDSHVVTWPGFQMLPDGRSRFFLQIKGTPTHNGRTWERGYAIDIPQTTIVLRNNQSHLVTRHYATPVEEAWLEKGKAAHKKKKKVGSVTLYFVLKQPVTPQMTTESNNDGFTYLYATFDKVEH